MALNDENTLSASQYVQLEPGTVNKGLENETRVITYFAMLLNRQDAVIDFTIYTSVKGLKPIDDLVVEIKFKDCEQPCKCDKTCEKREIWLTQIKHAEKKLLRCFKTASKQNRQNSQNEVARLPKEQTKQENTGEQSQTPKKDKEVEKQKKNQLEKRQNNQNEVLSLSANSTSSSANLIVEKSEAGVPQDEETKGNRKKREPTLDINLNQYIEAFNTLDSSCDIECDIRHWVNKNDVTNIILFTNAPPIDQSENALQLTVAKSEASWSKPFQDIVAKLGDDKCMKINDNKTIENGEFFDKFYCFVSQPNSETILNCIEEFQEIKGFSRDMVEQLCNLVNKHMSSHASKGMCNKLTKTDLADLCLTTVVMSNICAMRTCIPIKVDKLYADIWADIFKKYQIVQLSPQNSPEDSRRVHQNITGYYEYVIQKKYDPKFDWEKCFKSCFQLDETTKKKVKSAYTLADLLLHMWKVDRLPLLIDESITNLFFKFLNKDQRFKGCFFVIAKSDAFLNIRKFGDVAELSNNDPEIYDDIVNLEISLQGRKPVPLCKIFEDMKSVTATHLLLWTGQDKREVRSLPLYEKKYNVTLQDMPNYYDCMSIEIYLDIVEEKEEENKERRRIVAARICKNLLTQSINESDFLMWKGDQDDIRCSKLSKTRRVFEKDYERNGKTLKISLELEQSLRPDKILSLCTTMSDRVDPAGILDEQTGDHSILKNELKVKLCEPLQSNIYDLSLNVYVSKQDEWSHEDNECWCDKIDVEEVRAWMENKRIGIDNLVPKAITIQQSVDIVPVDEYKIKGGKLTISLQRTSKEGESLKAEIVNKIVDGINKVIEKENCAVPPDSKILIKNVPQIGNSIKEREVHTIIERFFENENSSVRFSEDEMGSRDRKKLAAISNESGMGKTTVLKSIATRCNPEDYILIYDLAYCVQNLNHLKKDPVAYLFDMTKPDCLEKSLFQQHLAKYRVKVLLDSFDEVLPLHENDALELLEKVLTHDLYTTVTTRSQAEGLLKKKFGTNIEIIRLLKLTDEQVKLYCTKENIPHAYIEKFDEEFLKVPLHLEMLRSIIETKEQAEIKEGKFVLCDFYEKFIDMKIDIFIKEKNNLSENTFERLGLTKDQMYGHLYHLSLVYIFGRDNTRDIIDDNTWNKIVGEFNNYVHPLGIVSQIDKENIKFVHRSYAEYLVAKWFCSEFEDSRQTDVHKKLYLKILEDNEALLLDFLNHKAIVDETYILHEAIKNRNKETVKSILDEDMRGQVKKTDILKRYPIDIAASLLSNNDTEINDYFDMLEVLFKYKADGIDNYWNWDESVIRILGVYYKQTYPGTKIVFVNNTSIHLAVTVGAMAHVKFLVEHACTSAHLLKLNYDGMNVLHLAVYHGHADIVQYLVEDRKLNCHRSTEESEVASNSESIVTRRFSLELAEVSKGHKRNEILKILRDNGCLASKILPIVTVTSRANAFTEVAILALAYTLSKDSDCKDFEIILSMPNSNTMFMDIVVLYTPQDSKAKQTAYFVETGYYKANLIFDENKKISGGDVKIPLKDCQTDMQKITTGDFDRQWKTKLANIDNYVFCFYTTKCLKAQTLPSRVESPLSVCPQQEVYEYNISDTGKILVHTKTISHVLLAQQFEEEMAFERYCEPDGRRKGREVASDIYHWMCATKNGCRPLPKRMYELICFKHKVKIPKSRFHKISSRPLHRNIFDKLVYFLHHNHLIYINDGDENVLALIIGYFEQYIKLHYLQAFSWDSCREHGSLPTNMIDFLLKSYALKIHALHELLEVLWMFDQQPLVIKQTTHLDLYLETYGHLKKTFIVLTGDQKAISTFDKSSKGLLDLVESIKLWTDKELTLPCTFADLVRASEDE